MSASFSHFIPHAVHGASLPVWLSQANGTSMSAVTNPLLATDLTCICMYACLVTDQHAGSLFNLVKDRDQGCTLLLGWEEATPQANKEELLALVGRLVDLSRLLSID